MNALDFAPEPETGEGALQAVWVPVKDIVSREDWQVRRGYDPGTVVAYSDAMRRGETLPPVKVANMSGTLVVVDGHHRLEAHRRNGKEHARCVVLECDEDTARWEAVNANLRHGLPLKRGDLRKAFRTYVNTGHHKRSKRRVKSYREMVPDLGGRVSHHTIRRWMQKDFPATFQALSSGHEAAEGPGGHRPGAAGWSRDRLREHLEAIGAEARSLSSADERHLLAAQLHNLSRQVMWEPIPEAQLSLPLDDLLDDF